MGSSLKYLIKQNTIMQIQFVINISYFKSFIFMREKNDDPTYNLKLRPN